jgi:3-methylcrotonyl-CoA carboxylase alpha subunit
MKYNLEINGETDALLVEQKDGGGMVITAAGKQRTVTACRIDAHRLVLNVDGAIRNVFLGGNDAAKQIVIDGVAYGVADADAKAMAAATGGTDREKPREVTPPMPAVVVKVLVALGQDVQKGEGLVVVSAMKMETTLTAPFGGRVTGINAAEGDKVMPGDILVDLQPNDAEKAGEAVSA